MDGKDFFFIADPDWRRYIGRYIAESKWYSKQKNVYDIRSRCWFTQYGFDKYHYLIDKMIDDTRQYCKDLHIRILKAEKLDNLVMKGKVQVIELLEDKIQHYQVAVVGGEYMQHKQKLIEAMTDKTNLKNGGIILC